MSDERRGVSLRTGRRGRPAISAPKQISAPIPQTGGEGLRNTGQASFDTPPPRPQPGGKVCRR